MLRAFPPVYSPVGFTAVVGALGARAPVTPAVIYGAELPSARFAGRRVLFTNSGTSALTLALQCYRNKLQRGAQANDQRPCVAMPAYGCPDLGTAAIAAGFSVRLYDTDPRTLSPDLNGLREVLSAGCSHLVVAHLLGRAVDMAPIKALADEFGTLLIEDAAQGAGGTRNGMPAGVLADVSVLSFGRGKGLNAGGGGALSVAEHTFSDIETDLRAAIDITSVSTWQRSVRDVAVVALSEVLSQPWLYWLPASIPALGLGQTEFKPPVQLAYPSAAQRQFILHALDKEPCLLKARQLVEQWYYERLSDYPQILVSPPEVPEHSGALRFPVLLDAHVAENYSRFGVARSYPRTLMEYAQIAPHVRGQSRSLMGAQELSAKLHTLPTHRLMRQSDRQALVSSLIKDLERTH